MKNLREYINSIINNFPFEDLKKYTIGKGSTQRASDYTEKYFENKTLEFFGDQIKIVKAGSQQYPDFLIIKKDRFEKADKQFLEDFKNKEIKGDSVFNLTLEYAKIDKEFSKSLVKFEIKSAKGKTYQCNDSFPSPIEHIIYVCINQKYSKVFINTSVQMAEAQGAEKLSFLINKYNEDKKQVREWRDNKKEEWKDFGVGSTPRMTYTVNESYAHVEQNENIFSKIIQILEIAGLNE